MAFFGNKKFIGENGLGWKTTAEEAIHGVDLKGKNFLLTGCNSGIGMETLRVLSLRGAHVFAAARTQEKARDAIEATGANGTPLACELSDPASVRSAVEAMKKNGTQLDGIIANAGIMALPKPVVSHGLELQFLTNHVGHFILVNGLLDQLAPKGRVVIVASAAHHSAPDDGVLFENLDWHQGYKPWPAYGMSKLANILFAKALAKRLNGKGQTANALHPGVIRTNLVRHMNPLAGITMSLIGKIFLKSIPQGAATQCYVAAHPDAANAKGEYFSDCNIAKPSRHGRNEEMAETLWAKTEEIVAKL